MSKETLEILKVLSGFLPIFTLLAAAIWFLWTEKFKPRIQFDIDCGFIFVNSNSSEVIAEIRLLFDNKGFVQHTLYNLEISVHGLNAAESLSVKEESKDLIFEKELLERSSAIPEGWYFWIRPGIHQVITKIIKFDVKYSVIRVTSAFSYKKKTKKRHTARRVFQVPVSYLHRGEIDKRTGVPVKQEKA
jgi:hypothetical protein